MRPAPRHRPRAARTEDPDATDPALRMPGFERPLRPTPTAEIVTPDPPDGRDLERDLMAIRFPHGILVVDFRRFAPAVLLH